LISYGYDSEDGYAKETAKWVEEAGQKAILSKGDLKDHQYCEDLVKLAIKEFGSLDILVNNAAFQMGHETLAEIPLEEW
ncbi:SDR family NAD(P)-dependent oxidoreductase, partial [Salmonella enterica]|uniref:SDR family NAD(P)-dependent oxidoreductase n=1 Tax=Salmonella enterica TaxID=28901 RepID=UPI0020C1F602